MIKRYRLLMITLFLLALLFAVSHYFLNTFGQYQKQQERAAVLKGRLRFYTQQRKELERKIRILDQTDRFVDKAKTAGLEKEAWSYYDVSIHELISFEEMAQIVNQCVNSSTAYFEPIMLQVKNTHHDPEAGSGRDSKSSAGDSEERIGDVLLTLKGKFVARRE